MANVDRSGKDPSRIEAGKKAAETRGSESLSEMGKKGAQSPSHAHGQHEGISKKAGETRGHESLSEAGRKGGQHSRSERSRDEDR